MDSDTRGRRGRARCSRGSSRSSGGLRLFSLKVVEKIRSRVRTTYNAVANELVSDQNTSGGNARDGKSIRRRCYDAINVLLACGLIKKDDKKQIVWRGHGCVEIDRLQAEIGKKAQEVEEKKKLLKDIERKHKTLKALLALGASRETEAQLCGCSSGESPCAGNRSPHDSQRFTIPFMLVQAPAGARVTVQCSEDRTQIEFELTETPPELHDDCSVVMRLQQYEAERRANQRCRKQGGVEPSQATDSGQPTPPQQAAAAAAAAAAPMPCNLSTPEAPGQLPPPTAAHPPLSQQQEPSSPMHLSRLQTQLRQETSPQSCQQPQQQQLPQQPQSQQQQQQQPLQQQLQQQQQPLTALPILLLAPGPPPSHQVLDRNAPQPEPPQHSDFLAHIKPVMVTTRGNKGKEWCAPQLPPVMHAQARTQAGAPLAVHPCPAGPSWQPSALAVVQPPQSLQPPQSQPSQSLPHLPHLPLQVGFSATGGSPQFLRARSHEQQLHSHPPCTAFGVRDCYQQHRGHFANGMPIQTQSSLGALEHHPNSLQHPMLQQQQQLQPLHQLPPPQPLQPSEPHQPQQLQEQQLPAQEQHSLLALGEMLAPSPQQSLYTLEQMGDDHLTSTLLPFTSDGPDPLGFGPGSGSHVVDQLGYMGWPYTMSPDPFSPSAFLVTPSFMKGQCRSEQTRSVGAMHHVGVQQ